MATPLGKKGFKNLAYTKAMLGLPSLKKDSNKIFKQSLERLLFPLQNKKFRIFMVAKSYSADSIKEMIREYQSIGNFIHSLTKKSKNVQSSKTQTDGYAYTFTQGENQSKSKGTNKSTSRGSSTSESFGGGFGFKLFGFGPSANASVSHSTSTNYTYGSSTTTTTGTSTSKSTSENKSTSDTQTYGITLDEVDKTAQYCENLIDKYVQRFQKGLNDGMWNVSVYLQSDSKSDLEHISYVLKSVYSGEESFYEHIRFSDSFESSTLFKRENVIYPFIESNLQSNALHSSFNGFSSALNTLELSLLNALPLKDVAGISIQKYSSFGLTQDSKDYIESKNMQIGYILNRKLKTSQRFYLSNEAINSHIFVSGITGSGKSNSIKQILLNSNVPFLVIEPAKSEYKHLISKIKDLQVFRPGFVSGDVQDCFRFNPFIFSGENLTRHVDMLKTTFCSAFPMYGPMSYILEDALHRIYEDKGWSFNTESNPYFTHASSAANERQALLFPNMLDLRDKIDEIVKEAGYAGELDSNIKAALKTRINNLTLGIKGKIFNSSHCIESKLLFDKNTIIELSHIADDNEKAFLMGLILDKLYVYREANGDSGNTLKHICVIEEAHRLLPNISTNTSSEEANPRAKAVESFVNLLAEIRSYGEGLIIADQIASKLHQDVIKNTNVKILHRTMDKEDRDLIGNAINLTPSQILDIAELKSGEAIVHNKDVHTAFMVSVDRVDSIIASENTFINFTKAFLESNESLKYELPLESRFYIPNFDINIFSEIPLDLLKQKCLQFISAILLDGNIKDSFNDFISLLDLKSLDSKGIDLKQEFIESKLQIYLFIYAFKSFKIMGNMKFYSDIDSYLDVYKAFIRVIQALQENMYQNLLRAINILKESFYHRNIKSSFQAMRAYPQDSIDYTLLIIESIKNNDALANKWKSIKDMQGFVYFIKSYFGSDDKGLVDCCRAITCDDANLIKLIGEKDVAK